MAGGNLDLIRKMQATIRTEAMRGTVEEALNALAAVSAEAIVTVPKADRGKLLGIYGTMVLAGVRQAEEAGAVQPFGIKVQ